MKVIGLTGGIGSGKNKVCYFFSRKKIPIIDTDKLSKIVLKNNMYLIHSLEKKLNIKLTNNKNKIIFPLLRKVFLNLSKKIKNEFEKNIHLKIRKLLNDKLKILSYRKTKYIIVVIPLLTENFNYFKKIVNRVILVDCFRELQILRTMERDNIKKKEVISILKIQSRRKFKIKISNECIVNNGDIEFLKNQVYSIHKRYLRKFK